MLYVIINHICAIFDFLQILLKIVLIWHLKFFLPVYFKIVFTYLLANQTPINLTFFFSLKWYGNIFRVWLVWVCPTDDCAFLSAIIIAELNSAYQKNLFGWLVFNLEKINNFILFLVSCDLNNSSTELLILLFLLIDDSINSHFEVKLFWW